ncbi:MAG: preprotein translocase subunit SecE [Parcubacteria group bacterium]|nr:preprotein translocase subunit SecE [Parcubacteria group bacterium]
MIRFFLNLPKNIWTFLKEVKIELKKVHWPSRRETIRGTFMVILISVIVSLIIGGFDLLFRFVLDKLIL